METYSYFCYRLNSWVPKNWPMYAMFKKYKRMKQCTHKNGSLVKIGPFHVSRKALSRYHRAKTKLNQIQLLQSWNMSLIIAEPLHIFFQNSKSLILSYLRTGWDTRSAAGKVPAWGWAPSSASQPVGSSAVAPPNIAVFAQTLRRRVFLVFLLWPIFKPVADSQFQIRCYFITRWDFKRQAFCGEGGKQKIRITTTEKIKIKHAILMLNNYKIK